MSVNMREKKILIKDTRTLDEKIDRLQRLGVNCSKVDMSDMNIGTLLGQMEDLHPNARIL